MSSSDALAPDPTVTDLEGLHRVCGTRDPNRRADIVFVHGLGGGARSTWEYGVEEVLGYFFWPAELGKDLPDCGVWTLGYEAGVVPWFGADGMPIEDRAVNLAHKMTTRGLGDRPVIFIAHSMGGLMVKEIVVQSLTTGDSAWARLVSNIAGIVFCGTPHRGSDVALMARHLATILRTQDHIRDMASGVRHLERLHSHFVEWQGETQVPIEAYAERLGMTRENIWLRWLTKLLIVSPGSADPQIKGCRCIPCNNHHTGLVKPANRDHDVYSGVLKFINTHLASSERKSQGMLTYAHSITTPKRNSLYLLPPVPQGFVGRKTDVETLRAVQPSNGALLAGFRGMGGIGKTALALVIAHEWSSRFPDAQLFLDGQGTRREPPPPTGGDLIAQVVQAFHPTAKLPNEEAVLISTYRQLLSDKKVLILLDNAHDAAQAAPLIPPSGNGLIVTSRQSFMLGVTKPHNVDRLPDDEAVALLREYHRGLADTDAAALVSLCAGLPLALRLAGAHLALDASERGGTPDVSGYLRALGSGPLKNLDADAHDAGVITISETLRLSEDQFSVEEAQAWHKLGVFTAPFEPLAAEEIAGADLSMLANFVRRSVLERDGQRYKLHDLVADYVRARLTEREFTEVRMAHAGHYIQVAGAAEQMYLRGDLVRALALFDQERPHFDSAFAWLTMQREPASAKLLLDLCFATVYTGDLRFHPRDQIAWAEAALTSAKIANNQKAEIAALGKLGNGLCVVGDVDKAIEFYDRALISAREIGDGFGEANVLGSLGVVHAMRGKVGKAIEFYEKARVIYRKIGDQRGEGSMLGNLGVAYKDLGDAHKSLQLHERSLAVWRKLGDRRGEGQSLGNIGVVHAKSGDQRNCIEFNKQSLAIAREIGDRGAEANSLGNIGTAYARLGDIKKSVEFHNQALILSRATGDSQSEGNSLWNCAIGFALLGQPGEAIAAATAALEIFDAIGSPTAEKVRTQLAKWRNA
ncbi:MAG: alpha/beta fold hydrolase [Chthoniobacterales bacterium]